MTLRHQISSILQIGCLCLMMGCVGENSSSLAEDEGNNLDPQGQGKTSGKTTSSKTGDTSGQGGSGTLTGGGGSIDMGVVGQDDGVSVDLGREEVDVAPFGELVPEEYARKVKFLLHGGVLTDQELIQVRNNPDEFNQLVSQWVESEAFDGKILLFLQDALQQDYTATVNDRTALASQLRASDVAGRIKPPHQLHRAMEEMFARTALKIIKDERPFSEIATTNKWVMTTSVAMYLLLADAPPRRDKGDKIHRFYGPKSNLPGFNSSTPLSKQIAERTWYVPKYEEGYFAYCNKEGMDRPEPAYVLSELWSSHHCADPDINSRMKIDDFQSWHEVTIKPLEGRKRLDYYNFPRVRQAVHEEHTLHLDLPRVGYFTTPAYLAKWRSNVDNSFRVTTNQALIVGLNESFEPESFTVPMTQEGLGKEHAEPGTACYGCHISLDPMRNYFAQVFDADYYSVAEEGNKSTDKASFGFMGHTYEGEDDLSALGHAIATHPLFAAGWIQKLCMFANSKACDPTDPEFKRIEKAFIDSNLNFKTMVVELFSSPLVTAASRTKTHDKTEYVPSITRKDHLCHALNTRLRDAGLRSYNACSFGNRMAPAIPADAWSRGATTPFQPATSSLFYSATIETFCTIVSNQILDQSGSPVRSSDPSGTIDFVVTGLMGLPKEDSRHGSIRTLVQDHYDKGLAQTQDVKTTVKSVFTLGCMSPFLSSIEF